ncbi:BLUF domain-containing protein [Lacinutrix sp. C3R15]|uniref:BLUF domain-containing protein n=1 Tax=Flavobacteriaceae TaxID=49546 RepID=UPI001C0A2A37|nr:MULTISPECIES: BLUF domain-containing protein [Flavobacteriaceae]MBU2939244.1 BLUF domain-containing protein [Lacinutrix sp. C3R15]MDO6622559.1 BLUF domain-containing protein [Oceanihabitans sp. 1_MG-2023]
MLKTISYKSKIKSTLKIMDFEILFNQTQTNNNSKNITGVLVKKKDTFFQILEGEAILLDMLFEKIKKDSRHSNIVELLNKPISALSFKGFDTGYAVIDHIDALYGLQTYVANLEHNEIENSSLFSQIIEELLSPK